MSGQEQINQSTNQEIQNLETIIQQLESEIMNVETTIECQTLKRVTINFFTNSQIKGKCQNRNIKRKSKLTTNLKTNKRIYLPARSEVTNI